MGEQSFEESEVPAGDSGDGSDRLGVGEVVWVQGLAQRAPVALQDEEQFVVAQGPVVVGEPDPAGGSG